MQTQLAGLWPPVSTPFAADGALDKARLVSHCRTLLDEGSAGLALLGTTSEANSLTLEERRGVIGAAIEAGIPASRLLPGTGACAIDDAVALTRYAGELGCAAVLLLPPFYYKGVPDDGLFAYVAAVIERAGPKVPRILLYHIPQMAGAGWSIPLIGRLIEAFPDIVVGMKDSTGDAANTRAVIEAFPGFAMFPGAEVYLLPALQWGAVGCISATANINARGISELIARRDTPEAPALQEALVAIRNSFTGFPTVPAVKAVLAAKYRDAVWNNVRPPNMPLGEAERQALLGKPAVAELLEAVAA
jgi:4-hydroxy-tetrahydrodipicolinate synthase